MIEDTASSSARLSPKLLRAFDLICALCDARIAPEQMHELESLVRADPEARRFYVEIMQMESLLTGDTACDCAQFNRGSRSSSWLV
jgi:hypothetical protein